MSLKKPSVNKIWLLVISGIVWSAVGLMLDLIVFIRWFPHFSEGYSLFVGFAGSFISLVIVILGFRYVAIKNINRILQYSGPVCVFAFQKWESYILVFFMIGLGIFMRNTSLVSIQIKAWIYIVMGMTLIFASLLYYRKFYLLHITNKINSTY